MQELADQGTMSLAYQKKITNTPEKLYNYISQLANGFVELLKYGIVHRYFMDDLEI